MADPPASRRPSVSIKRDFDPDSGGGHLTAGARDVWWDADVLKIFKLGGHYMKRLFLASTIVATWASLGSHAIAAELPSSGVAPRSSCAGLTGLTLPNTQILSATQKSGYCNVVGIINKRVSTQDPDHFTYGIGFALNLPNTWHGRFEMMGGGGTDGSLNADPQGAAGVE